MGIIWHGGTHWAQMIQWLDHHALPKDDRCARNPIGVVKVTAGRTLDDVRRALQRLIERYETLRTTFRYGPDDALQQVVHAPEPLDVHVRDAPPSAAAECAEKLVLELRALDFDLTRDWPIRVGVIRVDNEPDSVVFVIHHIAVDGQGMAVLRNAFDQLLRDEPQAADPVRVERVWRPRDQATLERRMESVNGNEASLSYWRRELTSCPAWILPTDPRSSARTHTALLRSRSVATAVVLLAKRHRTIPAAIILSAFNALLMHLTGARSIPVEVLVANRQRSAEAVGCLFAPLLTTFDNHPDARFSTLVAHCTRKMIHTSQFGQYDFAAMKEIAADVGFDRGVAVRPGIVYNYVGPGGFTDVDHEAEISDDDLTVTWIEPLWSGYDLSLDFRARLRDGLADLNVTVPQASMARRTVELFLRGVARLLTTQARGEDVPLRKLSGLTGLDPLDGGTDVTYVDNCRVDLQQVTRLLAAIPGVRSARVGTRSGPGDRVELGADLVVSDRRLTPERIRSHVLDSMHAYRSVICPHRFIVTAAGPTRNDHPGPGSPVTVGEASGRDVPRQPPATAQERALAAEIARISGNHAISVLHNYVKAGGRVASIPLVQDRLRQRGFQPPSVFDLCGIRSLRALAADMRRC